MSRESLGTIVRVPDGRIGTVVYNGLDGVGIKWGRHDPDPADFDGTYGGVAEPTRDVTDWPWKPDAMLREPYQYGDPDMEYVCDEYAAVVLRDGLHDWVDEDGDA